MFKLVVSCGLAVVIGASALNPATALTSTPTTRPAGQPAVRELAGQQPTVTASINRDTVTVGAGKVIVKGNAGRRSAGTTVQLQQRMLSNTAWSTSGTSVVKPDGRFTLQDHPHALGQREYRVRVPATDAIAARVSKSLPVTVYGWMALDEFTGPSTGISHGDAMLASVRYPDSLRLTMAGVAGSAQFSLGRKCQRLTATASLDDYSLLGATGSYLVSGDGRHLWVRDLTVGVQEQVSVDVTDVYALTVQLGSTQTPPGYPSLADARVLCTR